ncbi:redox-regulated ATPase YchF [Candidatus Peregrinibacteria bacterium RIFCSPLOWO2_02_FULL_39_10]|nr:MAG: redox-regulated ATPase YchF [Candidatus Peregrinibacteria bacterium RIFCSPLOWO2_02_FULL_39_10]
MSLKIGIVGLPNVGKSTLFNALTRTKNALSANYPFCTIDPNVGIVEVPDERIKKLAEISKSEKIIPAVVEFVDIAGLVKGASQGEGLGNKFLAHIRECSAIAHIVRIFDDPNVIHVHGKIDPKIDREVIESELLLSDIQTVENRLGKATSDAKSGDKDKKLYAEVIEKVFHKMQEGTLAIDIELSDEERKLLHDLHLLTMKPSIYIINLPESELNSVNRQKYAELLGIADMEKIVPICAKLEEECGALQEEEAKEYLKSLNIDDTGLHHLIKTAYNILGLITYFTSGTKETRAWTVRKGALAPEAAGVIHTDFEKGFIKAEVISYEDFIKTGGEVKAKEQGLLRIEGKEYEVKDGDVMHFRFSS